MWSPLRRAARPATGIRLSTWLSTVIAAVVVGTVPACSQVQDAASDTASQAVGDVTESIKSEAADQVRQQICQLTEKGAPLASGRVSATGKQAARQLTSVADSAGVPEDVVAPLRTIADGTQEQAQQAVDDLKKACR
ncbi:MAG: hypothetical protein ACRC35_00400 [Angustibacter sp.]